MPPIGIRSWKRAVGCAVAFLGTALVAVEVPPGFVAETVVTEINAATALLVTSEGRVIYAEQTGALRIWKEGRLLSQPALDLGERLDTYWERGLIGLALDPDYPRSPYLYLLYVAKAPYTHRVLSRFTMVGDCVEPGSEKVLLEGDDQSTLGGAVPAGHQGGPVCFGADGCLYVGLGEQTHGAAAPMLTTLQGKILRIRPDGSLPEDNPYYDQAEGKYRAIWAIGIRNPFGLALEPGTGRLFETDVGASAFEEINIIERGGHYGWPIAEGPSGKEAFIDPIHAYPPVIGRSICGAMFYPRTLSGEGTLFPEPWRGRFFFADWGAHWIKALDPEQPSQVATLARNLQAPVGLVPGPDGSLWVLNRGTIWRDGKDFKSRSGSLLRIRYQPGQADPAPLPVPFPAMLSETGWVRRDAPRELGPGFFPVRIQVPPWEPGVRVHYELRLPPREALHFDAGGELVYPAGSVVLQHYERIPGGEPWETRVFEFIGPRTVRAAAYRWNDAGTDAHCVEEGEISELPGAKERSWYTPGVEARLELDQAVTGFVLPLKASQVNRDGQLERWRREGRLRWREAEESEPSFRPLVSLEDEQSSLEDRVRSYLDVNCSGCHRPGGLSRGWFDARWETPLAEQGMLDGPLAAGDLSIAGARVVVPGHPERSILWQRLQRNDASRMPPVRFHEETSPVVSKMEQWIRSLPD